MSAEPAPKSVRNPLTLPSPPERERDANESAWTIGRLLFWTTEYFTKNGLEDARLAAEVLLAHVAEWRRIEVYTRFDRTLDEAVLSRFRELVRRAAAQEPIAYLVGKKEFYSLPFKVTGDVLIPRPETETLVECVVDYCTHETSKRPNVQTSKHVEVGPAANDAELASANVPGVPRILDFGTGSGCIVVATLTQLKQANAVASDNSTEALNIAKFNATRHGVTERVQFVQAEGLDLPSETVPDGGFDVVMSNPPYVSLESWKKLHPTVRDYEPKSAITDGTDGLTLYRVIASDALRLLAREGVIFVEIGDGSAEAVTDVFNQRNWVRRGTWKDRSTGRERVLSFGRA